VAVCMPSCPFVAVVSVPTLLFVAACGPTHLFVAVIKCQPVGGSPCVPTYMFAAPVCMPADVCVAVTALTSSDDQ
jgi:hypothetical protein